MRKWIAKKFIVGTLNKLLDVNKDNVDKVKSIVSTWIGRLEKILACLKSILDKLADNQLDSDELEESVSEIQGVVKQW